MKSASLQYAGHDLALMVTIEEKSKMMDCMLITLSHIFPTTSILAEIVNILPVTGSIDVKL